jgi:hypothetical protein
MLLESKNESISILYGRQSHDPPDTHTHASINNAEPFQVGPNFAVPRDNPRDSRYKFSLCPSFLKPWVLNVSDNCEISFNFFFGEESECSPKDSYGLLLLLVRYQSGLLVFY